MWRIVISYVNVFCIDILKVYLNVLIEKVFMILQS